MDNIATEVLINHQNLRQQYKELTKKILILNEKNKEDLHKKYELELKQADYYQDKCSSFHFIKGLYWRFKFIEKRYIGKKIIVKINKLEVRSDKISGEIAKFKVNPVSVS